LKDDIDSLETKTVADLAREYGPVETTVTYEETTYPAFEGQAL